VACRGVSWRVAACRARVRVLVYRFEVSLCSCCWWGRGGCRTGGGGLGSGGDVVELRRITTSNYGSGGGTCIHEDCDDDVHANRFERFFAGGGGAIAIVVVCLLTIAESREGAWSYSFSNPLTVIQPLPSRSLCWWDPSRNEWPVVLWSCCFWWSKKLSCPHRWRADSMMQLLAPPPHGSWWTNLS